jgi:dCMP deaminase
MSIFVDSLAMASTCDFNSNGAALVKGDRILATGFTAAPIGLPQCRDVGHDTSKFRMLVPNPEGMGGKAWQEVEVCRRPLPAELMAIMQAAKHGIALNGATLLTVRFPAPDTASIIIQAGITTVHSRYGSEDPRFEDASQRLRAAGVRVMIAQTEDERLEAERRFATGATGGMTPAQIMAAGMDLAARLSDTIQAEGERDGGEGTRTGGDGEEDHEARS